MKCHCRMLKHTFYHTYPLRGARIGCETNRVFVDLVGSLKNAVGLNLRRMWNKMKYDAMKMAEIAWKQEWYIKKPERTQRAPFLYDQFEGYMYSSGH